MSDLFISYSRRDAIFVRRLYDALRVADRTVWVDWEGIPFSAEWKGEIYSAIEAADAFVFVITVHSIASEICAEEVAHAVKHNKRLVPILLGPVEDQAVPASIRERNWLPFLDERDFGKSFTSLVNTIDADLDWVKSHTRLLTRAIEWNDKKRDSSFDLRGSDLHHAEALISEASTGKDPMLTPLQIEYVVASRRDFAKRQRLLFGLGTLVLLVAVVLGLLWLQKRQEATLIFARNLHEGALSALANYDPLAAEVLSARALTLDGRRENRELLFQARARTPLSAATVATSPGGSGLAFSGDGRLYASAVGNTVEIWDLISLSRVRTVALLDEAVAAAFSADNTRLAVSTTQTIAIWGVAAASDKPELQLETTGNTATLAFSPGGQTLASGGKDKLITLWDLARGGAVRARFAGHTDKIVSLAFGPDGRTLASGSWDNRVKIWDVAEAHELHTLVGHEDAVLSVAFSPDGKLVASGGWDNRVWLWDPAGGARLRALDGHMGGVTGLTFDPTGQWLASTSEDRTVRLWEAATGRPLVALHSRSGDMTAASFITMGGHPELAAADSTGQVRLWAIDSIGERAEITTLRGHAGPVSAVAFSPDGSLLATGSWDKAIRIWDLQHGGKPRELAGHRNAILSLEFSPDARHLASTSKDGTLRLWDTQTWTATLLGGEEGLGTQVRDATFSPDSRWLASAGDDRIIRLWDVEQAAEVRHFNGHDEKILGLAFSPRGDLLASASDDGLVRLWNTADWRVAHNLKGHAKTVWALAFSLDGNQLASVSDDRTLRLWNPATGAPIGAPLEHDGSVWSVDFSPDGRFIAAAGQDSTVSLWRTAANGSRAAERYMTLRLCNGPVWWVRFNRNPGDLALALGSADKTARVWRLGTAERLQTDPAALEAEAERETGLQVERESLDFRIVNEKRAASRGGAR